MFKMCFCPFLNSFLIFHFSNLCAFGILPLFVIIFILGLIWVTLVLTYTLFQLFPKFLYYDEKKLSLMLQQINSLF